ncbi:MAG: hypothetical protein R3C28_07430 [Pirellulaceae bacterium]
MTNGNLKQWTFTVCWGVLASLAWAQPDEPVSILEQTDELILGVESSADEPSEAGEPIDTEEGVETLLQGPVHEAFAEPLSDVEAAKLGTPMAPPAAVTEVPPDLGEDSEGAIWIPGYWAWDDERNEYIWISGLWRKPPQGRTWVPGTWTQDGDVYRWVSGYWELTDNIATQDIGNDGVAVAQRAAILPVPPASLENGPSTASPSDDHFWVPGTWLYQNSSYAWRPGFWSPCHENWMWIPDHYVYRPQGCVFVKGYWDYHWNNRGVLFAPAMFHHQVFRPGFVYRPTVVVSFGNVLDQLWVRPGYSHYYFGDYYGPAYTNYGIVPWYSYTTLSRRYYDPLFVYFSWSNRSRYDNPYNYLRDRYNFYSSHRDQRPSRTFHDYCHHHRDGGRRNTLAYAESLRKVPNHAGYRAIRFDHQGQVLAGRNKDLNRNVGRQGGGNRGHSQATGIRHAGNAQPNLVNRGDVVRGGNRGDVVRGGNRGDVVRGGNRGDVVRGGNRGDVVRGGNRGDVVRGGNRGDVVRGGNRGDVVRGGDRGAPSVLTPLDTNPKETTRLDRLSRNGANSDASIRDTRDRIRQMVLERSRNQNQNAGVVNPRAVPNQTSGNRQVLRPNVAAPSNNAGRNNVVRPNNVPRNIQPSRRGTTIQPRATKSLNSTPGVLPPNRTNRPNSVRPRSTVRPNAVRVQTPQATQTPRATRNLNQARNAVSPSQIRNGSVNANRVSTAPRQLQRPQPQIRSTPPSSRATARPRASSFNALQRKGASSAAQVRNQSRAMQQRANNRAGRKN